jgi:cephalosporin hydroxylase
VIVECGSWYGGSALWFADRGVDVITLDVDARNIVQAAKDHPAITIITGNSADPAIAEHVAELVDGKRVMVVLDSDHSPEHVEHEIDLYGPLVSPGCYLVVEDGIQRWMTNFAGLGPLDAIESRLSQRTEWERDMLVEAMYPITMHPAGWWRRA